MKRNLKSVSQFADGSPFTQSQVRGWIFSANTNGMARHNVIVRIGHRVYIDTDAFERWVDAQNQREATC